MIYFIKRGSILYLLIISSLFNLISCKKENNDNIESALKSIKKDAGKAKTENSNKCNTFKHKLSNKIYNILSKEVNGLINKVKKKDKINKEEKQILNNLNKNLKQLKKIFNKPKPIVLEKDDKQAFIKDFCIEFQKNFENKFNNDKQSNWHNYEKNFTSQFDNLFKPLEKVIGKSKKTRKFKSSLHICKDLMKNCSELSKTQKFKEDI